MAVVKHFGFVLIGAAMLFSLGAVAQQSEPPVPIDQQTSAALRRTIGASLETADLTRAAQAAHRYAELGGSLSMNGRQTVRPAMDADMFAQWSARLDANAAPFGDSNILANISGPRLIESLAPIRGGGWFISSVADARIYRVDSGGAAAPLAGSDGHGSVFGLAIDRRRNILWSARVIVPQSPAMPHFAGLLAQDATSGTIHRIVHAPAGASMGDLSVAADGAVYVSDPVNGAIYRGAADSIDVEQLVPPGVLRSPQGIAIDERRSRLYVSDYAHGIATIDRDTGYVSWLSSDVPAALDGIDGLLWYRGTLIAIQNGTIPHRIIQIILSRDGRRVTAIKVLERANPKWDEPTTGVIDGRNLVYIGNSQWRRFGDGAQIIGEEPLAPTEIRSVRMR
ncbi:MAG: hypothetical protein ABL882_00360 [Sphingopyxis sp.]